MTYLELKTGLKDFLVFTINDIRKLDPGFDRRRFSEWQKKEYIIKLRRGYYIFSDAQPNQEEELFAIASKLYGPSYVSLEMAFRYYNIIPEGVYSITSVATRKTAEFKTPVGNFTYHLIKPSLFFGYSLKSELGTTFKIAELEKAFLDYLYLKPHISKREDFEEMRFDPEMIARNFNFETFTKYVALFRNGSVKRRAETLATFLRHAQT